MSKDSLARKELRRSLKEAKNEEKETQFLTSGPSADLPLESRKREASKPLYLTRYE